MRSRAVEAGVLAAALLFMLQQAEAAQCPKKGGALRIGATAEVSSLDPSVAGSVSRSVYMNIFEPLVSLEPDGKLGPALATSWEPKGDTTWRLKLRQGVKFHSGTPFNAEVVRWNFKAETDPDKPGKGYALLKGMVQDVRVVDNYTVDIVLAHPYSPFLTFLAASLEAFPQRDPVKVKELGDQYGISPSGTGPFKFKEWKKGSQIVLEANRDHWAGGPCVDQIVYRFMPEPSTRYAALRAGEIDFTSGLPPEQLKTLQSSKDYRVELSASDRVISLLFNRQNPIWDDLRVRRAVSLAVDKKNIVQGLLGILATPTGSFLGPSHTGYIDVGFFEYDPKKSKALLAEAGYGSNKPLKFSLGLGPERDPRSKELAGAIQASLQEVGAQVELKAITWNVFYQSLWKAEGMDYDTIILGFASQSTDPHHNIYNQFHISRIPPTAQNFSRLRHEKLSALLDRQAAEFDPKKRLSLFSDIQHLIYDEVLAVPLYAQNRDWEMRASVKGFRPHPVEWWTYQFEGTWLDR